MSLALSRAASLKAEIRLSQAISEFTATLDPKRKAELGVLKSQSAPTFSTVIEFTKEIARDGNRQYGRHWLSRFGPRLEPLLHRIQMFGKAGDILIGGSQNIIASGVWACVRIFLQVAIGYISFFDKLSLLWDRIGQSSLIHAKLVELFPSSKELQKYMCEYLIIVVTFCQKALAFLQKSRMHQLAALALSFDQCFDNLERDTKSWSLLINETVMALMAEVQLDNKQVVSSSFSMLSSLVGSGKEREQHETKVQLLQQLSPSQDEFESIWRREQKKGSVYWIFDEKEYREWKTDPSSTTLIITGTLGSGKTVLMANLAKNLYSSSRNQANEPVIATFFCQYQNTKTLRPEVMLKSVAHQILRGISTSEYGQARSIYTAIDQRTSDTDAVFSALGKHLPTTRSYVVAIDALDECTPRDRKVVLDELFRLGTKVPLHLVLSARDQSDLVGKLNLLGKSHVISMANENKDAEIGDFIDKEITARGHQLGLGPEMEEKIKLALMTAAQGMYLWVVLQLDALFPLFGGCLSREDMVGTLENLPKDLSEAYDRALAKINVKFHDARLFKLVAGANRSLNLNELRVAMNITPGEAIWNTDTVEMNPHSLISRGGGGLLELDEANDTVLWIHHSAMAHLLRDCDKDGETQQGSWAAQNGHVFWHFDLPSAQLLMAVTCVTYLSLDLHDRRVHVRKPQLRPKEALKTIGESVGSSNKLAKIVKSMAGRSTTQEAARMDISRVLQDLRQAKIEGPDIALHFVHYSQEHWLVHTSTLLTEESPSEITQRCGALFRNLLSSETRVATKPWEPDSPRSALEWAVLHDHISVFEYFLGAFCAVGEPNTVPKSQLPWLVEIARRVNDPNKAGGKVIGKMLTSSIINCTSTRSDVDIVSDLLEMGANPNQVYAESHGSQKLTMLQLALQWWVGSPHHGAHEDLVDPYTRTAPYRATRSLVIQKLLEYGAIPIAEREDMGSSSLYLAIENGWADGAAAILKHTSPNVRALWRHADVSLLGAAIESLHMHCDENVSFMKTLLDDPYIKINTKKRYWHQNHTLSRMEAVKEPTGRWPSSLAWERKPPIIAAIALESWYLVDMLIDEKPMSRTRWMGITPLGLAVDTAAHFLGRESYMLSTDRRMTKVLGRLQYDKYEHLKVLRFYDNPPQLPLHIALSDGGRRLDQYRSMGLVAMVTTAQSLETPSTDGMLPFAMALESSNICQIQYFLEKGADPNQGYIFPSRGSRPILPLLAVMQREALPAGFKADADNRKEIVALLLEHAASPNIQVDGLSMLGYAIRFRYTDVLELLYNNYWPLLDLACVDAAGRSALQLAKRFGDDYTIKLLGSDGQFCPEPNTESLEGFKSYGERREEKESEDRCTTTQGLFEAVYENNEPLLNTYLHSLSRTMAVYPNFAGLALKRALERFKPTSGRVIKQFIKHGVHRQGQTDVPWLILAIANGKTDAVDFLLESGEPVNCPAATRYSTTYRNPQTDFLRIAYLSVDVYPGETALDLARRMGTTEVQRKLEAQLALDAL